MSKLHRGKLTALRGIVVVAAGLLMLTTTADPASAQYGSTITACGQKCQTGGCGADTSCRTASSGKCTVGGNISCTSAQSTIQLIDGTDLDLQGYDITCTSGPCTYDAITFYNSNSKVTTSTGGPAVVGGPFNSSVNCGNKSGSIVENITAAGGIIGIYNCQTVRNDVIDGQGVMVWGVIASGITSSDEVTDNFVTGAYYPIVTSTSQPVEILRNVVNTAGSVYGMTLGSGVSTANGNVKFNVFYGDSTLFVTAGTDSNAYDGNYCDPNQASCSTCISNGRCMPYTSPFVGN
jgi:hypothetical protein